MVSALSSCPTVQASPPMINFSPERVNEGEGPWSANIYYILIIYNIYITIYSKLPPYSTWENALGIPGHVPRWVKQASFESLLPPSLISSRSELAFQELTLEYTNHFSNKV